MEEKINKLKIEIFDLMEQRDRHTIEIQKLDKLKQEKVEELVKIRGQQK